MSSATEIPTSPAPDPFACYLRECAATDRRRAGAAQDPADQISGAARADGLEFAADAYEGILQIGPDASLDVRQILEYVADRAGPVACQAAYQRGQRDERRKLYGALLAAMQGVMRAIQEAERAEGTDA